MECPSCGESVGGIGLVIGFVKVTTFKCHCGRIWRGRDLLVGFDNRSFIIEIERLLKKYPADRPVHVKVAVEFLQSRVDRYVLDGESATLAKRRLDSWERQFIKQMRDEMDML